MIPKKIYLNWLKENEGPDISIWQREPLNELSDEYNSREYTDLSQVWHDASDEPQGYEYKVICDGRYGTLMWDPSMLTEYSWREYTRCWAVSQWAYVNDLIPK